MFGCIAASTVFATDALLRTFSTQKAPGFWIETDRRAKWDNT